MNEPDQSRRHVAASVRARLLDKARAGHDLGKQAKGSTGSGMRAQDGMDIEVKPTCQFDAALGDRAPGHGAPALAPNLRGQPGSGLNLRPAVGQEALPCDEPLIIHFARAAARPRRQFVEVGSFSVGGVCGG